MDERDAAMHTRDRDRDERITQVRIHQEKALTRTDLNEVFKDIKAVAVVAADADRKAEGAKICAGAAKKSVGRVWFYVGAVALLILGTLITAAVARSGGDKKFVVMSQEDLKKIVGGK